jgi:hypothetical protein
LTFAHILKTHLPPRLDGKPVEVYYAPPSQEQLEKAWNEGRIPISVILLEVSRAAGRQIMEEPTVREEDEEGNIVEYRLGIPTYIAPRYLITPWCKDPLEDQVVHGAILQLFFDRPNFMPEDIQGIAIHGEERNEIYFNEQFNVDEQVRIWQMLQRPYRASVVYSTTVRMDSVKKTLIRRVKERILDYKKLQG